MHHAKKFHKGFLKLFSHGTTDGQNHWGKILEIAVLLQMILAELRVREGFWFPLPCPIAVYDFPLPETRKNSD
jgi:hypothetical protein